MKQLILYAIIFTLGATFGAEYVMKYQKLVEVDSNSAIIEIDEQKYLYKIGEEEV